MIDINEFRRLYEADNHTPGFYINVKGIATEYIIIKYADNVQFGRCGTGDATAAYFATLDEMLNADQVDGINLMRDWAKVERIYPEGFGTFEEYCHFHKIEYKGELIDRQSHEEII